MEKIALWCTGFVLMGSGIWLAFLDQPLNALIVIIGMLGCFYFVINTRMGYAEVKKK